MRLFYRLRVPNLVGSQKWTNNKRPGPLFNLISEVKSVASWCLQAKRYCCCCCCCSYRCWSRVLPVASYQFAWLKPSKTRIGAPVWARAGWPAAGHKSIKLSHPMRCPGFWFALFYCNSCSLGDQQTKLDSASLVESVSGIDHLHHQALLQVCT